VFKIPKKFDPIKALYKESKELGEGKVQGYDFGKEFDVKKFMASFKETGFQASNLGRAIDLVKQMQKEKVTIFLGFTSNMASSGIRDIITYLVKNNLVHFIITTTGGLEEDIIKTHGDFLHGNFSADGEYLRKNGVNRTGNIYIPNDRYIWYYNYMQMFLKEIHSKYKAKKKQITTYDFVKELGMDLEHLENHEESFTYWCYKNEIPMLCMPLNDGATGDHLYFFKKDHPDFSIDVVNELEVLYDTVLNADKVGGIILGGSIPKHAIMNAFMLRDGGDYAVYINTGYEGEGSNAGANPEEAKSWGKALPDENNVKVWGEASIIFPILVAAAFKLK
jgi:deoxyhypusine synthase